MGIMMIETGPEKYAKMMSTEKTKAIAGQDGMIIDLDSLKVYAEIKVEPAENSFVPIEV